MRTNWVKWSCIPLALAGLLTSIGSDTAGGAAEEAASAVPSGALQYPLDSISCSSPEDCVGFHAQSAATTSDGGLTWASTRILNRGSLDAMACSTLRTCFAVGGDPVGNGTRQAPFGDYARVLRTTDGGSTWTPEPPRPSDIGGLSDISCPTRTYCIAVGASPYSALHQSVAIAVVTKNAGRTWRRLVLPKGELRLGWVTCSTPRACLAVGDRLGKAGDPGSGTEPSTIITDNGGSTWRQSHGSLGYGRPTCIRTNCFIATTFVYAMRYVYESTAYISKSTDGGQTWTNGMLPPAFNQSSVLSDITCMSATDCVAVGGLGVVVGPGMAQSSGTTYAAVLTTQDGGTTWIPGSVPTSVEGLSAISCPTATSCVAVGYHSSQRSTAHTAAVLVTHDGGATWTAES